MKRFLITILAFVSIYLPTLGQVSMDIELTKSGTLKHFNFTPYLANQITELTITGEIDASDIRFMRDNMDSLAVLDLSGVNIVYYSGTEGTLSGKYDIYLDDNMPIYSFKNKESLTSIILPQTATSIDIFAFIGCKNLKEVLISRSRLLSIGDSAFAGCISLSDSLIFPSTITSIGTAAFAGCKNLSVLYFPPSLTLIRQRAFESCSGLQQIINMRSVPISINENVFKGVDQAACSLSVLSSSICRYHNSPVWKEFSFERNCYSVHVINNNPAYGYVVGEGYHNADSSVILTAIPYSDYNFLRWSTTKYHIQGNDTTRKEEIVSTNTTFSFIITQDTIFTVYFGGNETNIKDIYFEKDFVNIYPNPTNKQLYLETNTHLGEIIMYDISGRRIKRWENTSSLIDISDFPSGIYFIKLSSGKNSVTRKVIKY